MRRAIAAAIVREARDQGRLTAALALAATALAFALGSSRHALPPLALVAAIVPPFALAWLPASVVDDGASGLARQVATQPLPTGAYALLRVASAATLLVALLAPALVAVALLEGRPGAIPLALAVGALASLWSAGAAALLGQAARGPAAASALWIVLCLANLLAVLRVWTGLDMHDVLVRAAHAIPGPGAAEALAPGADPWRFGAALLVAAQASIAATAAWVAASRPGRRLGAVGVAAALALPFLAPAGGVA